MGLAPAAAAVGDQFCVFFGGQVLYLLTQKGILSTNPWGKLVYMD